MSEAKQECVCVCAWLACLRHLRVGLLSRRSLHHDDNCSCKGWMNYIGREIQSRSSWLVDVPIVRMKMVMLFAHDCAHVLCFGIAAYVVDWKGGVEQEEGHVASMVHGLFCVAGVA